MEIIFVGSYLMCLFTSFYICQFVDVVFIYYHDMDDINLIWMQRNPNAKEMRNNSFPFYDEHLLIFGKDHAIEELRHHQMLLRSYMLKKLIGISILDETNGLTSNTMTLHVRKRGNFSDNLASRLCDVNMMLGKYIKQHNERVTMLVDHLIIYMNGWNLINWLICFFLPLIDILLLFIYKK